ncbi:DUF4352 domain-containing protein [Blastococcus litoris]|uniref:DUF4352 domain-containing protein n=1 Tax=Blastococcus litoris TaxID=2171622 RepID=UPI000E308C97|nr:DUF4352 domain-containing protein [Blastococcus litoris]
MSREETSTADPSADVPDAGARRTRLRLLLAAAAAVLVAALVVVLLVVNGDDDEPADPAASRIPVPTAAVPSSTAATTPAVPAPTGPVVNADDLPPALDPVPLDGTADAGTGITATLPAIEAIEGTGVGPGNVAGPALRVTVRIRNGSGEPVVLDGVAVNLYTGADLTPASPLDDPSQELFTGRLEPGESADGVYVFTVPTDRRDAVTVEVGYGPGVPFMRWTGPVG